MNSNASVRRIRRSTDDHVIAGVCGGIAEYFAIDPVIVRIAAVLAALFSGGAGLLAYLGAWIFIPRHPSSGETIRAPRRRHGHRDRRRILGAVLLGLGAINLLDRAGLGFRSGITWPLALIGVGAAVLWSRRDPAEDSSVPFDGRLDHLGLGGDYNAPSGVGTEGSGTDISGTDRWGTDRWGGHGRGRLRHGPPRWAHSGRWSTNGPVSDRDTVAASASPNGGGDAMTPTAVDVLPTRDPLLEEADRLDAELADVHRMAEERLRRTTVPSAPTALSTRRHRREPSRVGPVAVGAIMVSSGVLAAMDALGIAHPGPLTFIGTALLLLGLGLVAGTFMGRPRGFIFLGMILSAALAATSLFAIRWSGSIGDFTYVPTSVAALQSEYQVLAGQVGLDLRQVDFRGRSADMRAEIGFGQLVVLVPADVRVEVDAKLGAGELTAFGDTKNGLQPRLRAISPGKTTAAGVVRLHINGGAGQIEVARSGQLVHATFPSGDSGRARGLFKSPSLPSGPVPIGQSESPSLPEPASPPVPVATFTRGDAR